MTTLAIRDVHVSRDGRPVLRGVSLDVAPGTVCALMGRSGAGKSTILRAAAALQPFDAGRITVGDFALAPGLVPPESQLRSLRRKIGMVFQAHALFEHLTALENVTLAPINALGMSVPDASSTARALLDALGVGARAAALPRQLSGGEAQRVAIARALALDPGILLMDEPTASLDPARRGALSETLRSLAAQGRALLIATHDVDFAMGVATEVVILADGSIVERGAPRDILSEPRSDAARALLHHDDH
jgi:ABC-type polar amino acid transport system ATPase subunit